MNCTISQLYMWNLGIDKDNQYKGPWYVASEKKENRSVVIRTFADKYNELRDC